MQSRRIAVYLAALEHWKRFASLLSTILQHCRYMAASLQGLGTQPESARTPQGVKAPARATRSSASKPEEGDDEEGEGGDSGGDTEGSEASQDQDSD